MTVKTRNAQVTKVCLKKASVKYCISFSVQFFLFKSDLAVSNMKYGTRLPHVTYLLHL